MTVTRRAGLLSALAAIGAGRAARAADMAVTLLIGSPAGSAVDRTGRGAAACLGEHLPGMALSVRNLPGEAGWTMLAALSQAPADGATIGWVSTPGLVARMIDRRDPDLMQRLQLVGQVEREPVVFVSPARDPVDSVPDIIRRAADDADAVPLATPPPGSPPHLTALRLQALAQTRLSIVTFPSSAAAAQAVLAGNVSAAALGLSEVIDAIRDGNLAAIGVAARRRFGLLPDTPVLNEAGIPLSAFIGRGIAVPAGTPIDVVARLADGLRAVAADEAFQEVVRPSGYHLAWKDGATWRAEADAQRAVLTKLWETDPWLSSSGAGAG
ncbi:tripartite tricarboxylate transporter substrate binding protein [Rhodopila sp.]|uniref:tripartite tricarboxylate transporter substrate binding protein n=1 Tax=Rhodopila sp. TaxID=2480087 RepID=UPI002BB9263B|nr:tripartite tricarboxylate transporter substrate binding protein [Rhodopila sp.]HVZ07860.1 tripartite tricarboxylate transporter substrate binding protein [Rhodopila sp.]